jgi:thiamine biosynthesis protein ThiS
MVRKGSCFRLRGARPPLYGACMAEISITLNGEPRRVAVGSIAALVASIGLDPAKVAVERNLEIVPRSTLADVALADGDSLEIVHFVGGG